MSLCIVAGGKTVMLAASAFTLSWTHSVERTEWREDWRVTPAGLELVEARVKGSGAGMEPPAGARLSDGWWIYRPHLPVQRRVVLAASGATVGGWRLCAAGGCREIGVIAGSTTELLACETGLEGLPE